MKTKLTLTIKKEVIEKAKRMASGQGISLSKMIENIFEKDEPLVQTSESELAAKTLLKRLEEMETTQVPKESDKIALTRHLKEKYG